MVVGQSWFKDHHTACQTQDIPIKKLRLAGNSCQMRTIDLKGPNHSKGTCLFWVTITDNSTLGHARDFLITGLRSMMDYEPNGKKKIGAEWKNDYVGMHSCAILFKIEEDYGNSTRGWEPVMSPLAKWFPGLKRPCKVKMRLLCHMWTQLGLAFYHSQKRPIKHKICLKSQVFLLKNNEIEIKTNGRLLLPVRQSVIKRNLNLIRFFQDQIIRAIILLHAKKSYPFISPRPNYKSYNLIACQTIFFLYISNFWWSEVNHLLHYERKTKSKYRMPIGL